MKTAPLDNLSGAVFPRPALPGSPHRLVGGRDGVARGRGCDLEDAAGAAVVVHVGAIARGFGEAGDGVNHLPVRVVELDIDQEDAGGGLVHLDIPCDAKRAGQEGMEWEVAVRRVGK